ncbi:peptidase M22 [Acetanaerobacterium elongatum]|uniref:N(6)-L-threonylcarbamoyladenine synthase n=1 Tax=Acetanaerobacterium elongatum TaxID=258515 RepID=A0A1H0AQR3_9FIRM|nr:peptidase M22 [Acetanaerobacterium elongatum]SDN35731.1 N6-L-threonylcarbamoyladenine synthase [Acetanaerobacterium elongatum]
MAAFLGIDTSNYTTSAAVYDAKSNLIIHQKKLLPVEIGALGLKQSDAVFCHVKQLPVIMEQLSALQPAFDFDAVGYSARPRDAEGSYMPCFLVGECAARSIAAALKIPAYGFSHQAGHIAAALYSVKRLDLMNRRFIAFHVSGGTTDCLLVSPGKEQLLDINQIASSLDLKAGQAIDRVGVMLGLPFPAGRHLEELALTSSTRFKITPTIRGMDCCLSGLENICKRMVVDGKPSCDIAFYCIEHIAATLDKMTELVLKEYGNLPIIYAGGVMSNSIIRARFTEKYGGMFAEPEYSSDNAAGVAILTASKAGQLR